MTARAEKRGFVCRYYFRRKACVCAGSETWYNNLKAAAGAAARVQGTRPCAGAQGFENIEPCKTAAGAVLLRPLCGVMV